MRPKPGELWYYFHSKTCCNHAIIKRVYTDLAGRSLVDSCYVDNKNGIVHNLLELDGFLDMHTKSYDEWLKETQNG